MYSILQSVDLSSNRFDDTIGNVIAALAGSYVTSLALSHNELHGPLRGEDMRCYGYGDKTAQPLSDALIFHASHNRITGPLPIEFSWCNPRLTDVDLSYNLFTGAVPESYAYIPTLTLNGNPHLLSPNADLPEFMRFKPNDYERDEAGNFRCNRLKAADPAQLFSNYALDPSYYNHANCSCYPGYTGHPRDGCTACPGGTFKPDTSNSACTDCPPGKHHHDTAATKQASCVSCASGTVATAAGTTSCTPCSAGEAPDAAQTVSYTHLTLPTKRIV